METPRLDPPHVIADGDAALSDSPALLELATPEDSEQLQAHARQLAEYLRRRKAEVERREAELNARLAGLESEVRGARLWLSERVQELAEQKKDFERREQKLAAERQSLEQTRTNWQRECESYDAALAKRAAQLDAREAACLAAGTPGHMGAKLARLEAAEQSVAREQEDVARQRKELTLAREEAQAEIREERRLLADEQRHLRSQIERKRKLLYQRTVALRARRQGLEQLRADVRKVQQESLEMRLATEELWAQLCATAPPATLTQSLAKLRLQLAEAYRLNLEELAAAKAELCKLQGHIDDQWAKLAQQKQSLAAWTESRQRDFAAEAEQLAVRQRQLAQRAAEIEARETHWYSERRRYERQIRDLERQLRSPAGV